MSSLDIDLNLSSTGIPPVETTDESTGIKLGGGAIAAIVIACLIFVIIGSYAIYVTISNNSIKSGMYGYLSATDKIALTGNNYTVWVLLIIVAFVLLSFLFSTINFSYLRNASFTDILKSFLEDNFDIQFPTIAGYDTIGRGFFKLSNTSSCDKSGTCIGYNQDVSYLTLRFTKTNFERLGLYTLGSREAIILQGVAPHNLIYYDFNNYMVQDVSTGKIVAASLSDPINTGVLPFGDPFNIIITKNRGIAEDIRAKFIAEGIRENILIMPIAADYVNDEDLLSTYLRLTFFNSESERARYVYDNGILAYKVRLQEDTGVNAVPYQLSDIIFTPRPMEPNEKNTVLTTDGTLVPPNPGTLTNQEEMIEYRNARITELRNTFGATNVSPWFIFGDKPDLTIPDNGYICIRDQINCYGDNRATNYLASDKFSLNANQAIFVFGFNHNISKKTVYISNTLYNSDSALDIASINNINSTNSINDVFYTIAFTRKELPENFGIPNVMVGDLADITDTTKLGVINRTYQQQTPFIHVTAPAPESIVSAYGVIVTIP